VGRGHREVHPRPAHPGDAGSACRELDRAHAAEQALTRAGEFVLDRYQQAKAHPAIAVARSSRLAAARLVQALGLPDKES